MQRKHYFQTLIIVYIFCSKFNDKCVELLKSDKEEPFQKLNSLSASLMTFNFICIQTASLLGLAAAIILKLGPCPEYNVSVVFVNLYVLYVCDYYFKLKEFKYGRVQVFRMSFKDNSQDQ